ncbi:unnamed protein product, partial [marine sediment metagenome]
ISGRDKDTLEKWFGGLNVGLVAEHGKCICPHYPIGYSGLPHSHFVTQ